MATHAPITGAEAADRLAIRELVDAYAHCADTRDAKGQMALFTDDTRFLVFYDGDRATGESYCLAHHLKVGEDGQRTLMVASIRYLDEFVKQNGQWFFAERKLMVNWIDTRPSVSLGAPPSQSEQKLASRLYICASM
jgi:SnoaL-like protein